MIPSGVVADFLCSQSGHVRVEGNSMYPLLCEGEPVTLRPAGKELIPGKVYVFWQGTRLFAHRLLRQKGQTAFFSGDNSRLFQRIAVKDVVGECVVRQCRFFVRIMSIINYFMYIYQGRLLFCVKRKVAYLIAGEGL